MHKTPLYRRLSWLTSGLVAALLVLMPFYAFLTVWEASAIGHYTAVRLWKEALLCIAFVAAAAMVPLRQSLRRQLRNDGLFGLLAGYVAVELIWGVAALLRQDVSLKALGYAWIVNLRFVAFFFTAWVAAYGSNWLYQRWFKLTVWPAIVVVVFGLLQRFVLPYDFLKHFGYGPNTINPYETIDKKSQYIRIQSTLRGANPLGAYLVAVIPAVATKWRQWRNWRWLLLGAATLMVLFLTRSRSAWVGAGAAVLVMVLIYCARWRKVVLSVLAGMILAAGAAGYTFRNNDTFQNIFFHTDEHSVSATSSNADHLKASRRGAYEVLTEPLGRGPGSAGPASVYNNHPARIAENYFLQVGQETGWLGLGLFLAINCVIGYRLWRNRSDTLSLMLLAGLIGLSIVNLLSHAWTDDTLAYLWWGLAGIALGTVRATTHEN